MADKAFIAHRTNNCRLSYRTLTGMSLAEQYSESLAKLSGNAFQAEVCARLQGVVLSFQTVPAKPKGDAGLDGFSHGGARGCCCYGPEHDEFKTAKSRETAIIKKFRSDLRRLFELKSKKKSLVHKDSPEMAHILPTGQKIGHIDLICNWYESHRVLNPILSSVNQYKLASKCRYISADVSVVVIGPKDLANKYFVDELTIARAEQRIFISTVQDEAQTVTINLGDFDSKMEVLRRIRPDQITAIAALTELLRKNWRTALAFDNKLDLIQPKLRQTFEESRLRILKTVSELMLESNEPWTQLRHAETIAKDILKENFGIQFSYLISDVSSGVIARLIGECPIGWEAPPTSNG
jgi:hypothetical protein